MTNDKQALATAKEVATFFKAKDFGDGWYRMKAVCHPESDGDYTLAFKDPPKPGEQSLAVKCHSLDCDPNHIRHEMQKVSELRLCNCPQCVPRKKTTPISIKDLQRMDGATSCPKCKAPERVSIDYVNPDNASPYASLTCSCSCDVTYSDIHGNLTSIATANYRDWEQSIGYILPDQKPRARVRKDGREKRIYWDRGKGDADKGRKTKGRLYLCLNPQTPTTKGILVEGEKAAAALYSVNQVRNQYKIFCVGDSSGLVTSEIPDSMKDLVMILWPDNDRAGKKNMVAASKKFEPSFMVNISELDDKADAADILPDQILELVKNTRPINSPSGEVQPLLTASGNYVSGAVSNSEIALLSLEHYYSYDEFAETVCVDNKPIDDSIFSMLRREVEQQFDYTPTVDAMYNGLTNAARYNSFHPVKTWLRNLSWDGVDRFANMANTYFGYEGNHPEYADSIAALLFRGIVARVFIPGEKYDYMVILRGEQGVAKTESLQVIASQDYYSGSLYIDSYDISKTSMERSSGKLIVSCEDMAGLKGSDIEKVKGFITERQDTARMAFARFPVTRKRQFILTATANAVELFKDTTGNRRFPILECRNPDKDTVRLDLLRRDREQIFAQAVHMYEPGPVTLPKKFWELQNMLEDVYKVNSTISEWLDDHIPDEGEHYIVSNSLRDKLNSEGISGYANQGLSREMIHRGFVNKKVTIPRIGSRKRSWVRGSHKTGVELFAPTITVPGFE